MKTNENTVDIIAHWALFFLVMLIGSAVFTDLMMLHN